MILLVKQVSAQSIPIYYDNLKFLCLKHYDNLAKAQCFTNVEVFCRLDFIDILEYSKTKFRRILTHFKSHFPTRLI